ncbi:mechanosensitive ion channel domain-containing protein [Haloferula sp. A504]|uniref:mechanosensitive ion channel family protein n=1 Tax=Haloferula sp. A504 TaxID=3373601 RepID=UPI0031CB47C3|nr:mechanosensitive ion channel [Verrucomicrobiaceae bacterium E54]
MRFLPLISLLLLPLLHLSAQDETAPLTTEDPAVAVKKLELQLVPLTAAQLETEASAWQELAQKKAGELAEARIAALEAGKTTTKNVETLIAEEKELLNRLNTVLDSWEAKGGDPATMRTWLAAVRGAELRIDNPTGLAAAFKRWMEAEDGARAWLIKLIIFAVIVTIGLILGSVFSKLASKAMDRHKASSELLDRFVTTVVRRGILIIAIVIGLSTLGVKVGAILALVGGGAFILAFALQDTLGNFANGIMLMIYQPFDVGDAVEVGGVSGSVDSVSLVNTTIRSWDNKVIIVPNKNVWGQTITNITGADQRRVDMVFGIDYGDDVDKAQAILEKIVAEHELVLDDPEPTIKMHELADSSVNFICRPWAKTSDYWTVYWEVTKRVKQEFDAADITIPFPQREVHMHQAG